MSRRKRRNNTRQIILLAALIAFIAAAIGLLIVLIKGSSKKDPKPAPANTEAPVITAAPVDPGSTDEATPTDDPEASVEPDITEAPTQAPTGYNYGPVAPDDSAKAANYGFQTEMMVGGASASVFEPDDQIEFLHNDLYTQAEGVLSFRGSCFRQDPYYGVTTASEGKLQQLWQHDTYNVPKGEGGNYSGIWTGTGWTGQALCVRWDSETKAVMNMFDSAKAKDGLIEVISATMDGNIYFYDMETGEPTRNKLTFGVPFKGSGTIDPRGIPILYVGQGDHYKDSGKESIFGAIEQILNGSSVLDPKVVKRLTMLLSGKNSGEESGNSITCELSDREKEIAYLISEGLNNRQIANKLYISEGTVKNYISNIYDKTGIHDRVKLAMLLK